MFLFFDTETTGKPKNYRASAEEVDNWPRITQLAFCVFNEQRELIKEYCQLIKPDGWVVPKEQFFIDNNMSTERCEAEGVPILEALTELIEWRSKALHTAAHNISFDSKIVRAEMIRLNNRTEFTGQKHCTMKSSTNYCQLPGPHGFKWPKMEELYSVLFKKEMENAHDAMADVKVCAACFFELVNRNVIKL